MSNYRQIHTKIWKDDWFLELEPMDKLFFIYLFSNEQASLAGIYELSIRVMSFESGLTIPEIKDAFKLFTVWEKAYFSESVVWIPNLRKYHETKSPKVQTRILKDLAAVKDCSLKDAYCNSYGIDRVSENKNRVSIPPYTYTSTITSSSTTTSTYDGHEENQMMLDVITKICQVVKGQNPIAPSADLERAAQVITEAKTVDRIAGFSEWWQINGYYQGQPALKSFLAEYQNYLDGAVVVNKNGKQSDIKVESDGGMYV